VSGCDYELFKEAELFASEDMDDAPDIAYLTDMAPLAVHLRAGVEKPGIDLAPAGLAGADVELAAKLALMEIAFMVAHRQTIQQASKVWPLRRPKRKDG